MNFNCHSDKAGLFRSIGAFQINRREGSGHFVVSYLVGLGFFGASAREEKTIESRNCSILIYVLLTGFRRTLLAEAKVTVLHTFS